ncbi:MAG: YciI family protein [Chloroflexota bacterium]
MKYALLIYSNEAEDAKMTESEQQVDMNEYIALDNEINAAGKLAGGEALMPTSMATTVRVKNGKTLTTDGPFAETKEQLGGFYVVDCSDLDEAIGYAAKVPASKHGSVEVRPLMEIPQE